TRIGRAITLEYLRQGANVAANHLGLQKGENLGLSLLEEAQRLRRAAPESAPTGEILAIVGDVTGPKACDGLVAGAVEKWGALDIFVANAGIFKPSKFLEYVLHLCFLPCQPLLTAFLGSTSKCSTRLCKSTST